MKNRTLYTIMVLFSAAFIALGLANVSYASDGKFPKLPEKRGLFYYGSEYGQSIIYDFSGIQIRKPKYNKKILDVSYKNDANGNSSICADAKKVGSTKLSFKLKSGKKLKDYSIDVCVKKYKNPFTRITLGKRNLLKQYDNEPSCYLDRNDPEKLQDLDSGARFTVKLKRGWHLSKIRWVNVDDSGYGPTTKYVKNGAKLQFPDWECVHLTVFLRNNATRHIYRLYLTVDRKHPEDDE